MNDEWVLVQQDDGSFAPMHWPFCQADACNNRRCLALNSVYCYPHSMGMQPITTKEKEISA